MLDSKQIPYLVKLLDDDSPEVHQSVVKELSLYGLTLIDELKKYSLDLNLVQLNRINSIITHHKSRRLRAHWHDWFEEGSEMEKLETALVLLSEFLCEPSNEANLKVSLDQLALDYMRKHGEDDPLKLAKFLFKELALKGDEKDYYNPQNSNLIYVLNTKRGIPISLSSIFILVGKRLGIPVDGCHFPGHFLARVEKNGKKHFIDCFSSGQIIEEEEIVHVREDVISNLDQIIEEKADAEGMVRRFLANLIRAYQIQVQQIQEGEDDQSEAVIGPNSWHQKNNLERNGQLMIELFKELDCWVTERKISELTPEDFIIRGRAKYNLGELVRHGKYSYRGIIVDYDLYCKATDSWYYGNQSHPDRNQPWYHVLVHDSDQVTYVAESNLLADDMNEGITHPLLSYFFSKSEDSQYIRNENPWPNTDF